MRKKTAILILGFIFLAAPFCDYGGSAHEDHIEMGHRSTNVPLGLQGLKEMISVHPLFVHFPIGLLVMSTLFYWMGAFTKNEGLIQAGRWTLYGGAVFSIISVVTGLQAANTAPHDDEVHRILLLHQNLGYVILGLSMALSVWTLIVRSAIPAKGKWVFLAASLVLTAILTQQADLGGRMVFLNGVGVGKKSMLPQTTHDHGDHSH